MFKAEYSCSTYIRGQTIHITIHTSVTLLHKKKVLDVQRYMLYQSERDWLSALGNINNPSAARLHSHTPHPMTVTFAGIVLLID